MAWTPSLRETGVWAPPQLDPPKSDDHINTSLTYGFVFDMCGVEIDPDTGFVRVDRYVSMHDAGRLLNPMIAEGQIRGAFVQGLATALYEEFVYDADGEFLSGTFADYVIPTASELPPLEIMHIETPSPFTPLGAKGLAEGNCMSTPACIANAIADALGVKDVALPATPTRIHAMIAGPEPVRPAHIATSKAVGKADEKPSRQARRITGSGSVRVDGAPVKVWAALLDPDNLRAVIPGCHELELVSANTYRADVSLGVGPVKGRFKARVKLSDLKPVESGRIGGAISGPLGSASGSGLLTLSVDGGGTRIDYDFEVAVSGKAAAVGGRLLEGAAQLVVGQFFERFGKRLGSEVRGDKGKGLAGRLAGIFGGRK